MVSCTRWLEARNCRVVAMIHKPHGCCLGSRPWIRLNHSNPWTFPSYIPTDRPTTYRGKPRRSPTERKGVERSNEVDQIVTFRQDFIPRPPTNPNSKPKKILDMTNTVDNPASTPNSIALSNASNRFGRSIFFFPSCSVDGASLEPRHSLRHFLVLGAAFVEHVVC